MLKQNLITIITVVKNAETTIERCMDSVLKQNYKNKLIINSNLRNDTITLYKK